jgi:uncharacterized protein
VVGRGRPRHEPKVSTHGTQAAKFAEKPSSISGHGLAGNAGVGLFEVAAPGLVLDTNTVLDWLLFRDPGIANLGAAIDGHTLRWLACARMRDEFERTLGYPTLAKWQPDSERLLLQFDRAAVMRPTPPTLPSLRCTDPDDQVFIDLAVAEGARWLITHDRALLKLARRASALGVQICRPASWQAP